MGWAIALHGGAGDISKDLPAARKEAVLACLALCLRLAVDALQSEASALDVVERVVSLENPIFTKEFFLRCLFLARLCAYIPP